MSNYQVNRQQGNFYPVAAAYPYPGYLMSAVPGQPMHPVQQQQQGQMQQVQPPSIQQQQPAQQQQHQSTDVPGMLPIEQSYVENILRLNKGKLVKVYMTFENNPSWNAKVFTGVIEAAGRDHLILSEPNTGKRYLLLMVYLDYVEFDEEINYQYPFGGSSGQLSTFPPR
ncbi:MULTISPECIES: spore coat protein GerQ [Bacillaceae]|uniref:Spore gernimation protein GerQ n=1 Tax=Oceanobacillus caeni TaxID=405946 RepID=A0ABR5MGE7_9BACI|nr:MULTISPECIES: spore coat protein GerQ [Bacillaceae]KPH71700.1 spore gernimation protein GerQ [Oceanobacillus caeni]